MASDLDQEATYRRPSGEDDPPIEASFRLAVVDGTSPAQFIDITPSMPMPVIVGQSPSASLRLTEKTVSRQHAAVTIDGPRLRLVDRGSTNGTRVNGLEVKEVFLRGGETLSMGDAILSLTRTVSRSRERRSTHEAFGRTWGSSEAMQRIYGLCEQAAASDAPVSIEGEAGTGKDLLAECIHERSPRSAGPLIVMSCAGVALDELQRDLFGTDDVPSAFEEATGGTIVLDDIGELSAEMQARVLRVLSAKAVRRGQGAAPIPVDARLVSTSRRNLDRATEKGLFSADLQALVVGIRIELPPLRERKGDVGILAALFWRELGGGVGLAAERLAQLEDQPWPGNVRELQSYLTRTATLDARPAPRDAPSAETGLNEWIAERGVRGDALEDVLALDLPFTQARKAAIAAFERRYVERVLAQHKGNVSLASAASGIARRYLQMIKRRAGA
jgi:DNA-binding NtrC family response regulator